MDKTYKPELIETRCYANWEKNNYFAPKNDCKGQGLPYCIMLPPPNVTGSLHMGHAFQQTLMDILIRYHRMNGDETLWQCGTDHAGIATQMVVERQLQQQGIARSTLGREKFIDTVWEWKEHSGNTITRQSRRLGTSMDWSRERFTMDEGLSHAVKEAFIRLYDEGLIYRGTRLVNWDPVLQTAISDLEVIAEEEEGKLWYIRYPLLETVADMNYVIVATTRPETMLGDAAVAVNPDDERYKKLIGKKIKLPIANREIPIIADDYVDPEFGTGCVKITPAHDFNDYDLWCRHKQNIMSFNVPHHGLINIFAANASIVTSIPSDIEQTALDNRDLKLDIRGGSHVAALIPETYQGSDRYTAREQILVDLAALGLIEKTERHKLMVPRGDRSRAVIEPYLTAQWFLNIQPLAEPAIQAVKNGAIKFVPANWDKTYYEWMTNIEDWCISRQLWWGHRIPVWYDERGQHYVGRDEADVRAKNNLDDDIRLMQDEDVLDTWFSSALWPFSTLGWPEKTPDLDKFYPTNVLVTGFDIIFFWVARMIMFGLKFMDDVPFKEIYIHGLVRDGEGQKMSKSKGNALDPIDLIDGIQLHELIAKHTSGMMQPQILTKIEEATRKHFPEGIKAYGTDPLRFTFASLATQSRFINFEIGRIQGYRNFCNKLWNAARYVMGNVEAQSIEINQGETEFGLAERWITTRLSELVSATKAGIQSYRFDLATQALYEFIWEEYCDWYIELSKTTLNSEQVSRATKRGTLYTLLNVLEVLLRALHPFMPFITEDLWCRIAPLLDKKRKSIMLESFPKAAEFDMDIAAVEQIEWIKAFIMGIRRARAERDIAPRKLLTVFFRNGTNAETLWLAEHQTYIRSIARISSINPAKTEMDDAVMVLVGEMTLFIPLTEFIDAEEENKRLTKTLEKLKIKKSELENKLANNYFVERAPHDIVSGAKKQLADILNEIKVYQQQLKSISKPF